MGTDIQIFLEEWDQQQWMFRGTMESNLEPMTEAEEIQPTERPQSLYDGRNYSLYAILGFPSSRTFSDELYIPIAPLRGLPTDCSGEVQTWYAYFKQDDLPERPLRNWTSWSQSASFSLFAGNNEFVKKQWWNRQ